MNPAWTRLLLWLLLGFVTVLLVSQVLHARPGMPGYHTMSFEERPDPQMPRPVRPALPEIHQTSETVP